MRKSILLAALFAMAGTAVAAADTVKIGLIEPLSGPIAAVGQEALDSMNAAAAAVNASGGVMGKMIEIVPLDNAMNAEKTTQQLRKAIDDGLRYVTQGVGSNHALNIIKQINKHNKRNPDSSVMFFNHSAVTTAFTNELCSFWHFRFDANVDMKVAALLSAMGADSKVSKVYMLNQNYAYGKSFQAAANKLFKERIPNGELVGDDLMVPFGKVQDFTPFVSKIKSAGADTVLTGNWGPDLVRFVKAAADAGLDVQFYTIYGGIPSSMAGFGKAAAEKVSLKQVSEFHLNEDIADDARTFAEAYLGKYNRSWYADRYRWVIAMFAAAANKAGSVDPVAVGKAMEGMTFEGPVGTVTMRADDHQIQLPMIVSEVTDSANVPFIYDGKDFGFAWATKSAIPADIVSQPTTCKMTRP